MPPTMRGRVSAVAGVAALALALAVGSAFPVSAQDGVRVGIVLPLTGNLAFFGEMEKNSFDLALEEINAAGGIRGKKLELLIEDDKGRPDVGRSVAEKLIGQDKVVLLGGGYSSAVSASIAKVAQERRIPFLINTGAADFITETGWDYVFRLNPPASEYASSAVNFLTEVVKPRTLAVIHEDTAFGQSQSKSFEEASQRAGMTVILKESYSPEDVRLRDFKLWRMSQILLRVKRARPDVVYMISYLLDASLLMRQAWALEWTPKLFFGGGAGFTLPAFYELTQEAAEKVMTITLWHESLPYPGAADYAEKFRSRYSQEADYHGAEAYAAAYVIADALKRAKSFEPEDVRTALLKTKAMTPFGPVEFLTGGGKTNQNRLSTYVAQWIDGRLELVWPEDVAQTRYVYPIEAPR